MKKLYPSHQESLSQTCFMNTEEAQKCIRSFIVVNYRREEKCHLHYLRRERVIQCFITKLHCFLRSMKYLQVGRKTSNVGEESGGRYSELIDDLLMSEFFFTGHVFINGQYCNDLNPLPPSLPLPLPTATMAVLTLQLCNRILAHSAWATSEQSEDTTQVSDRAKIESIKTNVPPAILVL